MAASKTGDGAGRPGGLHEPEVEYVDEVGSGLPKARTRQGMVMTRAKLKQSGGSLIFTVPAAARKAMQLNAGDEVDVTVDNGRLILDPVEPEAPMTRVRRPKYTIEQLVEGYNADAPLSDEEQAWMDAPAAGRETW